MFLIFVLVLAIITILLSYFLWPERSDDIDYRMQPEKPLPEEVPPVQEWSPPAIYSDGYAPDRLIDETPAPTQERKSLGSSSDWYTHYRDYIGLSHAEIKARFSQAPNLEGYKERYESRKGT